MVFDAQLEVEVLHGFHRSQTILLIVPKESEVSEETKFSVGVSELEDVLGDHET